jgi:hypothetical protein
MVLTQSLGALLLLVGASEIMRAAELVATEVLAVGQTLNLARLELAHPNRVTMGVAEVAVQTIQQLYKQAAVAVQQKQVILTAQVKAVMA